MGSIQGIIYALCIERDMSMLKLGWNIKLLTVAYMVILQIPRTKILLTRFVINTFLIFLHI